MLEPSAFPRTRFAPSPTGRMHLGHAYSALIAWHAASCNPEQFLLRIDDIDSTRCKDEFTDHLIDDLAWLGISWSAPPIYQSKRTQRYEAALSWLEDQKLVYACSLSRKEYEASLSAPQETQNNGLAMSPSETQSRVPALRLDMVLPRQPSGDQRQARSDCFAAAAVPMTSPARTDACTPTMV